MTKGDGMTGKGDTNKRYQVHGDGVDSLATGFDEIAMPENRRAEALAIVQEVLAVNDARDLRWYKVVSKDELCCYWDDQPANVLWITANNVHVRADESLVRRPERRLTWSEHDGYSVGWLLPGAISGSSASTPQKPRTAEVHCPVANISHPAGTDCPVCDIVHDE